MPPTHWLIRIGDGVNFWNSSKFHIWSANSKNSTDMHFLETAVEGDILWFVTCKSKGHLVAVATYSKAVARNVGPLINVTRTNEELGWDDEGSKYDTEIHYTDLFKIADLKLLSRINSPLMKRVYNEKCAVNLPAEYAMIQRYKCIEPVPLGVGAAPLPVSDVFDFDSDADTD